MKYLKVIHIGNFIKKRYHELDIPVDRACIFLNCQEKEIEQTFLKEMIDTDKLLKWSKLLSYDFFRLYSHHLLLYAPVASTNSNNQDQTSLPEFRKNIYTKEIIDYVLMLIKTNEKTPEQIIKDYRIPKTTLYRWINKNKSEK